MAPLWVQGTVLGLVQGVSEFLPVSSSGHLILVPFLTGWPHLGKAFDVALHLGTAVAIIAHFQNEVRGMGRVLAGEGDAWHRQLLVWLVAATVPAGVVGLLLDDYLESTFGGPRSVAPLLALFGLVLGWADRVGQKNREMRQLRPRDVALIGCAQILALVPGVSRCGITLTAGLFCGLTRGEAARFSFLMALPVTLGAFILKSGQLFGGGLSPEMMSACFLGMIIAAGSGWLCIRSLLDYLRRSDLRPFMYYRVALALLIASVIA